MNHPPDDKPPLVPPGLRQVASGLHARWTSHVAGYIAAPASSESATMLH